MQKKKHILKVLVVDDEQDFTDLMLHVLRQDACEIQAANSAEEALEIIKDTGVDILITDVMMPGMNGFELMQQTVDINPDTLVIAISAHGDIDTAVEFMKHGAIDFIQKPVDNVEVKLALESAADKWRLRRALREANRELREMNISLQKEMAERERAEQQLTEANKDLEHALGELTQAQRQLVEQERLGALGQMARGVAHDFNNALQPIMLAVGLIEAHAQHMDGSDALREYIDEIVKASRDAASTVRRLVQFYRRTPEMEATAINVSELAASVIDITKPKWGDEALARGRTIQVKQELGANCLVSGLRDELREVFVNLIFNAEEAIREKGTITVTTRRTNGTVIIEVADDGCGMKEEVRAKCLEPFYTTRDDAGSGLGLSIVVGVVERLKGTIQVESSEGDGTRIVIELPAMEPVPDEQKAHEGPEEKAAAMTEPPPPSRGNILVVDDAEQMRKLLAKVLRHMGHDVVLGSTGTEALTAFREGRFDLVITDQAMPEMTGDQLARKIKELSPGTPIIMVTGFGDLIEAENGKSDDIDLLLSKPIQINKLREAIVSLMPIGRL